MDRRPDAHPPAQLGRSAARRPTQSLARHFGTHSLEGFGFADDDGPAIQAAGAVLDYLAETQKSSLAHIDRLLPYRRASRLEIDEATRRSLEIVADDPRRPPRGVAAGRDGPHRHGDGRPACSADWLAGAADRRRRRSTPGSTPSPSCTPTRRSVADLREALAPIYDMERLLARVTTGRATPRDLSFIGRTLRLPAQGEGEARRPQGGAARAARRAARPVRRRARQARSGARRRLPARRPATAASSARAFTPSSTRQRDLAKGGKQWIAAYQAEAVQRTGIPSMKVGFNQVFGYYLEVTHAHRDKVPADFIRKQTLKNAERYVTPELKEHEEKVLAAEEKSKDLEYDLFIELRETVAAAAQAHSSDGRGARRGRRARGPGRPGPLAQLRAADDRRRAGARHRRRPASGARRDRGGGDVCAERRALRGIAGVQESGVQESDDVGRLILATPHLCNS